MNVTDASHRDGRGAMRSMADMRGALDVAHGEGCLGYEGARVAQGIGRRSMKAFSMYTQASSLEWDARRDAREGYKAG